MMRAAADSLTEQEANRQLAFAAGGLALLGVLLLIGTIMWWRSTRPESPALAPLEVMSGRRWTQASEAERRRLADEVRPQGGHLATERPDPVPVDLSRAVDDEAPDRFDDLREMDELLGLANVAPVAVAGGVVAGGVVAGDADLDEVPVDAVAPIEDAAVIDDASSEPSSESETEADTAAETESGRAEEGEPDPSVAADTEAEGSEDHHDELLVDDGVDGEVSDDDGTAMIAIDPLLRLSQPD